MMVVKFHDNTLYMFHQGQWRGDMHNGQGTMMHSSGVIYDGLWLNGRPVAMATKLVITGYENSLIETTQGQPFSLTVECRDENDELVPGKVGVECFYPFF